jgi:acyl-CoA synthetase (AMP-forming)/AMP-acid ligase II
MAQPILPEMTLGDLIRVNANQRGDRAAVIFEGRHYTHRTFRDRVFRLANGLIGLGARSQDRIAVLAPNCSEYFEIFGAGEVAGFIIVNLNIRLSESELVAICNDCHPTVLIADAEYAPLAERLQATVPGIACTLRFDTDGAPGSPYEKLLATSACSEPSLRAKPQDTVYLIYTSGSTGQPKGVMWNHAAALEAARIVSHEGDLAADDVSLCVMPLFHIGAKLEQLGVTLLGGTIVLHRQFSVEAVIDAIERDGITAALLAPIMIQRVVDSPRVGKRHAGTLRCVHYASAPMPLPVLRRALDTFGPVFIQMYGMTECQGLTLLKKHQHKPNGSPEDVKRLGSVGQIAYGCSLRIVAPDGTDCPAGEAGEIWLGTVAVMQGYWNNHVATIEALRDGWMHTGDVGYADEQGFLYIVDRKKDMIISGGENIYSWEVEEALRTHPAVSEVAVIGVPDTQWGESVKACVVLRPHVPATAQDLIDHCRASIASYKKPRSVDFMDALPRLAAGKVDKKALREPYWSGRSKQVS